MTLLLSKVVFFFFFVINLHNQHAYASSPDDSSKEGKKQSLMTSSVPVVVQNMINWLQSFQDGYLNPKVDIRRWDTNDPTSYFGIFANDDIQIGELILKIPKEMIFSLPDDYDDEDEDDEDDDDDEDEDGL